MTAAGAREVLEESGYTGPARHLRSRHSNPALFGNQLHTVLVHPAEPTAMGRSDTAAERTAVELVPAREWLAPRYAAELDHPYTALAVHDLRRLLGADRETDSAAAAAALIELMAGRAHGSH